MREDVGAMAAASPLHQRPQLTDHSIDSLRILFDILDTSRNGMISYEQMEDKWRELPTTHFPANFLECLKRVTPFNGMLTFERFLAGVRLSLYEKNSHNPAIQSQLHRVRSEGKLNATCNESMARTQHGRGCSALPAMGLNGYPRTEQLHRYRSQPSSINQMHSQHSDDGDSNRNYKAISLNSRKILAASQNNLFSSRNSSSNGSSCGVVMRSKKLKRAPAPPSEKAEISLPNPQKQQQSNPRRPSSTNSMGSICSSGMSDVKWQRHSRLSNSPPTSKYSEDLHSKVAKHEKLLEEEHGIVEKGMQATRSLLEWFEKRMESLEKRRRMLSKGMVALDSAVHEQKLNFYRAQITELSRRMKALIASSERGFPTHENMQIRSQVPPPTNTPSFCGESIVQTTTGSSSSNSTNSYSPSPEPQQMHMLRRQQQKLMLELDAKSRMIEQLQREKRMFEVRQAQFFNGIDKNRNSNYCHTGMAPTTLINTMEHRYAPAIGGGNGNYAKVRDTLL